MIHDAYTATCLKPSAILQKSSLGVFLIWQNKSLEVDCFRDVFFVCALKSTHPGLLKISGLQEGVYTFQMTVTDTAGQKSSDNISVTVLAPKHQAEGNESPKLPSMFCNFLCAALITAKGYVTCDIFLYHLREKMCSYCILICAHSMYRSLLKLPI